MAIDTDGNSEGSLKGRLLVATPVIQESCFAKSVVYVCAHNEAGAMGVIINYPVENLAIADIFEQLEIEPTAHTRQLPVHFGGPVDSNRGFVLHSDDYKAEGSIVGENGIVLTSNMSILRDVAQGAGPQEGLLTLGYAGWGAGQLETEIEQGSWIAAPANRKLVFETDNDLKWHLSAASLGVDLTRLSSIVGHA